MTEALKNQILQVTASLKQHTDVIDSLRSAPEHEAIATLLRLRSTPHVSAVVSSIRTSVSPNRLSEPRTARAVMPATDTEIEFELAVHHKIVYPALPPIDVLSLDLNNLIRLNSKSSSPGRSVAAIIAEQNAISDTIKAGTIGPSLIFPKASSPLRGAPARRTSAAIGPPRPSYYCDPRFQDLDLLFWTTIPIDSDFAARAILHYLKTDHVHHGCFDADLFLNDLTQRRLEYCSAFL